MKKMALLAAAAAFVCAPSAFAQTSGYLGLRYSTGELDQGASADVDAWHGEGEVGANHGAWGWQMGGSFGNVDVEPTGDSDFFTLNGHLNWGNESWRVGGFVVYGSIDDLDVEETTYGIEGSVAVGANTTIFGSGSLGAIDAATDTDTWNVDVALAHYFSDNFRLMGTVGTGHLEDYDYDTTSYGINAEFQPFSAPLSFTAGWNALSIESSGFDADGSYFSVGARWNFGGTTLRERNNATPFNQPTGYAQRVFGATLY